MKFEHILKVNCGSDSVLLDRRLLWLGLLHRAEDARLFMPGLDSCKIVVRRKHLICRELHFNKVVIRDRVTFVEEEWMRFEVEMTEEHPGGSLIIKIEESETDGLCLRFSYETTLPESEGEEGEKVADLVRSAYYYSDIDTLKVIKNLVYSGQIS